MTPPTSAPSWKAVAARFSCKSRNAGPGPVWIERAGCLAQRRAGIVSEGANATQTGRGTVSVAPFGVSVPFDGSIANVTIESER